VPLAYVEQESRDGLAHALLAADDQIDGEFMLMLGDNVFGAPPSAVVERHRKADADATLLVEAVPHEEASRYGVVLTDGDGGVVDLVEKPEDPPSNLVLTGFYLFSPSILHAAHLVQPSDRGEYELTDAIDLLVESGHTVEAVRMDGWRVDVGYPEDRDRAERLLSGKSTTRSDGSGR
jgi:glucose-1-phosphate thymidylyltransferase